MKEEQKYNGSKTRNYFTAYLLASIRGKRLRYLEKQQKILFAEENLEDKEYTDADISPEEKKCECFLFSYNEWHGYE